MTRSLLLCKFDYLVSEKNLSDSQLAKEAKLFWAWATKNNFLECPFPEYLVKFHKGEWCPFS